MSKASGNRRGLGFIEEGAAYAALDAAMLRAAETNEETTMSGVTQTTSEEEQGAPMEAWDAIADGYDQYVAPGEEQLARAALQLAGLRPGDRFLDVAAGTGGLSLPAAKLGARVVATDWAPQMIERFRARAREQGFDAEGRVMDCHQLDFPDDSFDVTGSQFGVMLVSDQPRALREMTRVTRPGGRVVVIAYGDPGGFEALHLFIGALQAVVPDFHGLPDDPPPLEFQNADPKVLEQRLSEAGLRDVEVHTDHEEAIEIRSGEALWNWCLGGNPIPGMLVGGLSDSQKASVREALDRAIRDRSDGLAAAVLTAPINIGVGTV